MVKRALYYVSRMISSQKNTVFAGSHYEKLRKVYSIWILTNAPKKTGNTITKYRLAEEQLVGSVCARESDYDLLTIVMLRLGAPDKADSGSILRFLDVLLSSELNVLEKKAILTRDFDVAMTTSMEQEASEMCNVAEGIREEAEKKGRKEGLKEGRIDVALNLMSTLKMSAEEVLTAMRVPAKSRAELLKLINERLAAR